MRKTKFVELTTNRSRKVYINISNIGYIQEAKGCDGIGCRIAVSGSGDIYVKEDYEKVTNMVFQECL